MYILIDLGATNVRIAASKKLEGVSFKNIKKFKIANDFEVDFDNIINAIKEISDEKVEVIGVGVPGKCDEDKKFLISETNLINWIKKPFSEKLSREFNCLVFADNDAVVASLSEDFQKQMNGENFIYLTWGTGIGGALVKNENGKISSENMSRGTFLDDWEAKCSGKNIPKQFGKLAQDLNEKDWIKLRKDFIYYIEKISEEFKEKNIILGGGATAKEKNNLQKIIKPLEEKGINLKISNLDDEVGLYGAMALIKNNLK